MAFVEPVTLQLGRIALVPLAAQHEAGLRAAAQDGEPWKLRPTSVPEPHDISVYIVSTLKTVNRIAFAVTNADIQQVLGTTRFHDTVPKLKHVEIGYTWCAAPCQHTHVNITTKLLLTHAFETLACHVVGWRMA